MDDDLQGSFRIYVDGGENPDGTSNGGFTRSDQEGKTAFYNDVEVAKKEIEHLDVMYESLVESHEEMKAARDSHTVIEIRNRLNRDLEKIIKLAKQINKKLDALVLSSAALRMLPGSGPGSAEDQARSDAIYGLEEHIHHMMRQFQGFRTHMEAEQRQLIHNRFFSITGQKATEENIENIISSSVPEIALREAVEEQGRESVLDTVQEIKERRDCMMEMRKVMMCLHQVLLGMAAPVEARMRPANMTATERLSLLEPGLQKPLAQAQPSADAYDNVTPRQADVSGLPKAFRMIDDNNRVNKPTAVLLLLVAVCAIVLIIWLNVTNENSNVNGTLD